jgi:hypothetical protein
MARSDRTPTCCAYLNVFALPKRLQCHPKCQLLLYIKMEMGVQTLHLSFAPHHFQARESGSDPLRVITYTKVNTCAALDCAALEGVSATNPRAVEVGPF